MSVLFATNADNVPITMNFISLDYRDGELEIDTDPPLPAGGKIFRGASTITDGVELGAAVKVYEAP